MSKVDDKTAKKIEAKLEEYRQQLIEKKTPRHLIPSMVDELAARLWHEAEENCIRMDAAGDDAESARARMIRRQQGATDRFHEREAAKEAIRDPYEGMDGLKRTELKERDRVAKYNADCREAEQQRVHDRDEYYRHSGVIGKETKFLNREAAKLSE